MPNVFYTNRPFHPGDIVDIRDFCHANREIVERLPPVYRKVETLLAWAQEAVLEEYKHAASEKETPIERRIAEQQIHDFPTRLCAITVIPWPTYPEHERIKKGVKLTRMKDPHGEGRYCYYIQPKHDALRLMVDEGWVDDLIARWPEIQGTQEAEHIAIAYWFGQLKSLEAAPTMLVEGDVLIEAECLG